MLSQEQLIALQNRYKLDSEIAKATGKSRQYIYQSRKKYGIKKVRRIDVLVRRNESIYTDFKSGKFKKVEIARMYNLHTFTVDRIIKEHAKH